MRKKLLIMETKHTPGPWLVHDSYDEDQKIIVWDGDEQAHKPICDMGEIGDMNYADELANAKLIAAAPDLLEALKATIFELLELKAYYLREADSFEGDEKKMYLMNASATDSKLIKAEAAIKKATE